MKHQAHKILQHKFSYQYTFHEDCKQIVLLEDLILLTIFTKNLVKDLIRQYNDTKQRLDMQK